MRTLSSDAKPSVAMCREAEWSIATWQRRWAELPAPTVPTMVIDHAATSRGRGALARLASGSVSAPSPRRTMSDPAEQIHASAGD